MNILRMLREKAKDYDCSVCGTNHGRSEISVVGRRQGAYVVRVVCSKCDTNITLLVYAGEKPTATVKPSTTAPKRSRRPPLTLDDVIDAHDLLESFTGDVSELFAHRGKVRSSTDIS
ncbi:MAG TPA: hypothetical protein VM052_02195 [Candidatus Limnocylindrales bacterium]|nr:hypothetical protein [Candidatus Limnocylindrales bacterium]